MRVGDPLEWSLAFLNRIEEEVAPTNTALTQEQQQPLRRYYTGWLRGRYAAWRRASRWRYAARVAHALRWLSRFDDPPSVLDAGSGVGTDSIIMGAAGARVLGLDLNTDRVGTAQARLAFYRNLYPPMDVTFAAQNIFDLEAGSFDLIWVNEAISHIDPPERFLGLCRQRLSSRGALMISDTNAMNPVNPPLMYLRRGREVKIAVPDPQTGELVSYAQEQLLSVRLICRMLRESGLRVIQACSLSFVPTPLCPFPPVFRVEEVLGRLPLLKQVGLVYVVAAVRD